MARLLCLRTRRASTCLNAVVLLLALFRPLMAGVVASPLVANVQGDHDSLINSRVEDPSKRAVPAGAELRISPPRNTWTQVSPIDPLPNHAPMRLFDQESLDQLYQHLREWLGDLFRSSNRPTTIYRRSISGLRLLSGGSQDVQAYLVWYNSQIGDWKRRLPPPDGGTVRIWETSPGFKNTVASPQIMASWARDRIYDPRPGQASTGLLYPVRQTTPRNPLTFAVAFLIQRSDQPRYGPLAPPEDLVFGPLETPPEPDWQSFQANRGWGPGFDRIVRHTANEKDQVQLVLRWLAEGGTIDAFMDGIEVAAEIEQQAQEEAQAHANAQIAEANLLEAILRDLEANPLPQAPDQPDVQPNVQEGDTPRTTPSTDSLISLLRQDIALQGQRATDSNGQPEEQDQGIEAMLLDCLEDPESLTPRPLSNPPGDDAPVGSSRLTSAELAEFVDEMLS